MLVSIFTAPESGLPMCSHARVYVLEHVGIAGDRYATGKGFYSGVVEWDARVTLIQQEPFDVLAAEHGVIVDPRDLRRNLVTRGVDLNALIGRRFRIGSQVILRGRKAWPPCAHVVRLSGQTAIFKHLARQCGIGADVLAGGLIQVGDPIVVEQGA